MKDHEGCERGFIWSAKAWYHDALNDRDIMFGMYCPDGGTSGEMAMRWHDLGTGLPAPRLEVFCDAWSALWQFQDVLAELAEHDGENITEEEFVEILKAHGVKDMTSYESPYPKGAIMRKRLAELEAEKAKIEKELAAM